MASSTNQLTIVLGVADERLRAGIKRAQTHLKGLERGLNRSGAAGTRAGAQINAGAKTAAVGLAGARKSVGRFSEAVRTSIVNMKFLGTLLVGGMLTRGVVKFSASFEKSLAEVNTLLFNSTVKVQDLGRELKALASTTPKDLLDLSASLYQIISAGVPASEAMKVLTESTRLAVSSLSETKDASNLLITTLNAYKETGLDAATATDKLTRIYQLGRTRVTEMSRAFGRGAPIAAQFGVTVDELGGLLISLTRAGLNTNESLTAIRALMAGIAKPTLKTKKLLKELNVAFGQGAIDASGFTGVLENLLVATGGNVDVLARLFPNIRALLPAVVTIGSGFDEFRGHIDAVKNSFGATDEALSKTDDKFFKSAALLKSNFQNALVEIGEGVLPVVQEKFDALSDWLKSEDGGQFADTLGTLIRALIEVASVTGRLVTSALKPMIDFVGKNTKVIGSLIKTLLLVKGASMIAAASMKLFGAMGMMAGKSWSKGLMMSFNAKRLAMMGVDTAKMTNKKMAKTLGNSRATARWGSAIAVGLRGALSFAMTAIMGIGIITMVVSAIYDQFFGEAEEQAKERARKLKEKMEKEAEKVKKLLDRLERERTGATPEKMKQLRERQESGTVIKLTTQESQELIELGAYGPTDLAKESEKYVEAKKIYQKLVGAFAAQLGEEGKTDEGLAKARERATTKIQELLAPRLTGLSKTISSEFKGADDAVAKATARILVQVDRARDAIPAKWRGLGSEFADAWFDFGQSRRPLDRLMSLIDLQTGELKTKQAKIRAAFSNENEKLGPESINDREARVDEEEWLESGGTVISDRGASPTARPASDEYFADRSTLAHLDFIRKKLKEIRENGPEAEKALLDVLKAPGIAVGTILKTIPEDTRGAISQVNLLVRDGITPDKLGLPDRGRWKAALAPLKESLSETFLAGINEGSTELRSYSLPLIREQAALLARVDKAREKREQKLKNLRATTPDFNDEIMARHMMRLKFQAEAVRTAILSASKLGNIERTASVRTGKFHTNEAGESVPTIKEFTITSDSDQVMETFNLEDMGFDAGDHLDFSKFEGVASLETNFSRILELNKGIAAIVKAVSASRGKDVSQSEHQRRVLSRIIVLARNLNVVLDDGVVKANKRNNSLLDFVKNLIAANKAQKALKKTTGKRGRDYRRSFNKAIARLIDKTQKQWIKNNVAQAKLQVARNKGLAQEHALMAKSAQLGRSYYGDQRQMVEAVTSALSTQRMVVLRGIEIQKKATEEQINAAKEERDRSVKRERDRLKELLRGNAASGGVGRANREKMEEAVASFRAQREWDAAIKIGKLRDNLNKRLDASRRKAAELDLKVLETQLKGISGRADKVRDQITLINADVKNAEARLKQSSGVRDFVSIQRELLKLKDKERERNLELIRIEEKKQRVIKHGNEEERKQRVLKEGKEVGAALPYLGHLEALLNSRKRELAETKRELADIQKPINPAVEEGGVFAAMANQRVLAPVWASRVKQLEGLVGQSKFYVAEYKRSLDKLKKARDERLAGGDPVIDEKKLAKSELAVRRLRDQIEDLEKAASSERMKELLKGLSGVERGREGAWLRVAKGLKEADERAKLLGDRLSRLPYHVRRTLEQTGLLPHDLLESELILKEMVRDLQTADLPKLGNLGVEILKTAKQFGKEVADVPLRATKSAVEFVATLTAQLGKIGVGDFGFITTAAVDFAKKSTDFLIKGADLAGSRFGMTLGKGMSKFIGEASGGASEAFGKNAGTWFGVAVASILSGALEVVSSTVIAPIISTVGKPFSILSSGISEAFDALTQEGLLSEEAFRERMEKINREHDLRVAHIFEEADKAASGIDEDLKKTQDINKIKELTAKREEVRTKRDEELLEARRRFAQKESEEKKKQKGPEGIVEKYINQALSLVNTLVERLPALAVSAVQSLTEHLPTIIIGAATALANTLSAIAPLMGDLILSVVQGLLAALPDLIRAAGDFSVGLVEGVLDGFVEIMGNFDQIAEPLIGAIVRNVPKIIAAVIRSSPKILAATIKMIPILLVELAKGLGTLIKGIFVDAGNALLEVVSFGLAGKGEDSSFLGGALGGGLLGAGVAGGLGWYSGAGAVAGLTGPLGVGIMGGAALLGGLGSALDWWHKGGTVGDGNRHPVGAMLLAGLGARGFAAGGMVDGMQGAINGSRLRALRRGVDDVPAVLQAGEAVLNRQAVLNLGEETISALNSGQAPESGPTSVHVSINPDAAGLGSVVAQLLPHLISGVNAEVDRPGSKMRIDNMRVGNRPLGTMRPRRG